jgi:hypothetical protein
MPDDAKRFFQNVVDARNHLAHSFFFSAAVVHTSEGVGQLLAEVRQLAIVFDQAYRFLEQVLSTLAAHEGIDLSAVKEDARIALVRLQKNGRDG